MFILIKLQIPVRIINITKYNEVRNVRMTEIIQKNSAISANTPNMLSVSIHQTKTNDETRQVCWLKKKNVNI